MTCPYPIRLSKKGINELLVPCGRCIQCRIRKASEWATRIMHESDYHKGNCFITLTYDQENLPADNGVDKTEFQRFMKRLRKRVDKKIKYYACGEYGTKNGRPHYHAIIFGLPQSEETEEIIKDVWSAGRISVDGLSFDSARYVADYIQKKWYGDSSVSAFPDRPEPFQLQSNGIGRSFALDNKERIESTLNITMRGKNVGIPRYYQKILELDKDAFQEQKNEHSRSVYDHYRKKGLTTRHVYIEGIQPARMQAERNTKARISMRRNSEL